MDEYFFRSTAAAFVLPSGACDCHCHVFGPWHRYPVHSVEGYAPPVGELVDYLAVAERLGFERRVFVQPVTYGGDNSCVLDAIDKAGVNTARAIGGIPESPVAERVLVEWHRRGMRGLRLNYTPYKPYEVGFLEAQLPAIERTAAMVRELGWMLDVLAPNWLLVEMLPHLARLDAPFSVGHFGKFSARNGADHPAFRRFLAEFRDIAGLHVKLAAAYQVSDAPGFGDVAPLAQALYEAAPDRVLWGTDWPHMRHEEHGNTTQLLNLFGAWFPDADDRRRILVDNPARLFGF